MKLKQIILEEQSDEEILEILERDCKRFLEICDNKFLYRGSKTQSTDNSLKKIKMRKDRAPRDMKANTHVMLDNYFEDNFGIRYRSAAVFVTGSKENAEDYGKVYAVFPIGDFSFIYSPIIVDLYSNIKHNEIVSSLNPFKKPTKIKHTQESINAYLDSGKYTNKNLLAGIKKGNEIMIHCDEYYIIPLRTLQKIKFKSYVKKIWNKVTK